MQCAVPRRLSSRAGRSRGGEADWWWPVKGGQRRGEVRTAQGQRTEKTVILEDRVGTVIPEDSGQGRTAQRQRTVRTVRIVKSVWKMRTYKRQ